MHLFSLHVWLLTIIAECCCLYNVKLDRESHRRVSREVGELDRVMKIFFHDRPLDHHVLRQKRSSFLVPYNDAQFKDSQVSHEEPNAEVEKETAGHQRYAVAAVDFGHVSSPYIITLWILIAGLAKIGFQVTPKLRMICPESCVLLLIGVAIGLVLFFTGITTVEFLTPNIFFLYMLPPIVLDAGYFMPNRLFFDNLLTILVFAVIGTIWNAFTIGLSLWGIGLTGLYNRRLPLLDTLLFSSIISAVDPVAVLAVFEEIHVNEILYIIVFGESLLNDAVTVVLYHLFESYAEMGLSNIYAEDYAAGFASFFVVALGGTAMGIIWGILAAFISRFTHHVLAIEPLFVFVMAYLSYLTAELFHLSGIMALTFCGITMKNYVQENVSHKSHVTVKYTMKMLASSSETIIFVLLGVATVNNRHEWNTWFVLFTVLFCLTYRALGVVILTAVVNRFRLHQLNIVEQFIMSYGGLRGAVAFALVLVIDEEVIPSKNMMVTAVISVVYFTVFVQGMTIGFFVNTLKVSKSTKTEISMNERLHNTMIDHVMAGIEGISDHLLGNFKLRDKFRHYNNKIIRRLLTNNSSVQEPKLIQTHSKLNMNDALNMAKSNPNLSASQNASSLSAVFKSYSQANMNSLAPDEMHSPAGANTLLNVDLGELNYNPSFKDLADAEIHHILEDSMFKPPKKVRRYSRSEIHENPVKPLAFHQQTRMQVRRLVSESRKARSRPSVRKEMSRRPQNVEILRYTSKSEDHLRGQPYSVKDKSQVPQIVLDDGTEDEDDGGITFSVRTEQPSPARNGQVSASRTVTETTLPWKRGFGNRGKVCPRDEGPHQSQEKLYHMGYLSPTSEEHGPSSSSGQTFGAREKTPFAEVSGEMKQGAPKRKGSIRDEEKTVKESEKVESRDAKRLTKDKNQHSEGHEVSETVFASDDVRSTGSAETLSIEGPDPGLGIENEGFDGYKYKE